jgi:hypothetical protein
MKPWIAVLALAAATPAAAFRLPALPPISGATVTAQGVTLRFPADGCTLKKADLTVAVDKTDGRILVVVARRRPKPTVCAAAASADIAWSFAELGVQPGQSFSLANPLVGPSSTDAP